MQTKLIQFFIFIFSFLFCLFSLLGCDKFEEYQRNKAERIKQEKIERNKRVERETVERHKKWTRKANINGIPVLMPSCIGMERDGDPPFLSKKWKDVDLKKRGKSTYKTSARAIWFDLEFKRDLLRMCVKGDVFIDDTKYYAKDFGNPQSAWVGVSLDAGERTPKITMTKFANNMLERYERSKSGWEAYMQTGELFGL